MQTLKYVAVFGSMEFPFELTVDGRGRGTDAFTTRMKVEELILRHGLRWPSTTTSIVVHTYQLTIDGLTLKRTPHYSCGFTIEEIEKLPSEFSAAVHEILTGVPSQFWHAAYQHVGGGSQAYVLTKLRAFVAAIDEPLREYTHMMRKSFLDELVMSPTVAATAQADPAPDDATDSDDADNSFLTLKKAVMINVLTDLYRSCPRVANLPREMLVAITNHVLNDGALDEAIHASLCLAVKAIAGFDPDEEPIVETPDFALNKVVDTRTDL